MPLVNWLSPALAAVAFTASSGAPAGPTQENEVVNEDPPTAEEIQLSRDRNSRYTLPVTINGSGPYTFLVDTGAEATVLSRTLADTLDLGDRRPVTLVGMASRRQTETVAIDALTFGTRTVHVRTAPLVDPEDLGFIHGVLGLDALQDQRVLLDFKRELIAVDDAAELGGNSGFEIVVRARERLGQLIIGSARINGIRTAIIVDTGAQGSVGNAQLERMLSAETAGFQWTTDINGVVQPHPVKRVSSIQIGQMRLRNVYVAFSDAEPFKVLGLDNQPAMILGLSELKRFDRVAIDFSSARIRFDLPRDTDFRTFYGGEMQITE